MIEFEAIVHGKVQGVFYRAFAQNAADELGVKGIAENRSDGTVRIVAQGREDILQTFVAKLHQGPPYADVAEVRVNWREPTDAFSDFSISG